MPKSSSQNPLSPTGRLTTSEPEPQYFPGTPQDLAQRRRMKAALEQGNAPLIDFSSIEDKVEIAKLQSYLQGQS